MLVLTLQVSNCYNDTRTEALKAKTKRVRPYRLSEALDCYGGDKVHLFLVIDDLREEDGGNYTCFGLSSNLQEASNQIQVVPGMLYCFTLNNKVKKRDSKKEGCLALL